MDCACSESTPAAQARPLGAAPMHVRRKTALAAATLALACAWLGTYLVGVPAVRRPLLSNAQRKAAVGPQHTAVDVSDWPAESLSAVRQSYWVRVRVVLPLLLLIDEGGSCGPVCGEGTTAWYFWVPGFTHRVWLRGAWVA